MPKTDTTKHPAPFSQVVLDEIAGVIFDEHIRKMNKGESAKVKILDPFAGIGKIHTLSEGNKYVATVGVELEPEWANQHPLTEVGDALNLRFRKNSFDVIATSPAYGNRMADHHNAKDGSDRRSYKHYLGREPSEGSSSVLYWGDAYRDLHAKFLAEASRVLKPDGLFVLNISNHKKTLKRGEPAVEQRVSEWFMGVFLSMGYKLEHVVPIKTPRYKYGQNSETRTEHEFVICMRKP